MANSPKAGVKPPPPPTAVPLPRWGRIGVLVAAVALAAAGPADAPSIRAARWLAPGADVAAVLAVEPAECLTLPKAAEARQRVEVGRAAFRSPLLLGGQAARAGLACESCHRNGRGHAQFSFPGLSGAPGTADVTASLFSSHRGDGVDDPRPIPDLAGPPATLKVARAPSAGALKPFIRGLIVEEFDGAKPPPEVLDGLAAYVAALSPGACPRWPTTRVTLAARLADARRAVRAASRAAAAGDRATAALMIGAARAELGLIHERYAGPELAADRALVRAADLELAAALAALRARRRGVDARLSAWLARSGDWERTLTRDEPRSLFDPVRLRAVYATYAGAGAGTAAAAAAVLPQ